MYFDFVGFREALKEKVKPEVANDPATMNQAVSQCHDAVKAAVTQGQTSIFIPKEYTTSGKKMPFDFTDYVQ